MSNDKKLKELQRVHGELAEIMDDVRGIMGLAEVAWDFDGEDEMLAEAEEHMEEALARLKDVRL